MQFLTSAPNFRKGGGAADPLTRPSQASTPLHIQKSSAPKEAGWALPELMNALLVMPVITEAKRGCRLQHPTSWRYIARQFRRTVLYWCPSDFIPQKWQEILCTPWSRNKCNIHIHDFWGHLL